MKKGKDIILKPKKVRVRANGEEFDGLLISSKATSTGLTHRITCKGGEIAIHVPHNKV